jgi:hypothetical protein
MSATTSAPAAVVDTQSGSRTDGRSLANPSRTQSTRSRPNAGAPSPIRPTSYSRPPSSSRLEEVLPTRDYETTNTAQSSRKRDTDRSSHTRGDSIRSSHGHHRSSSRSQYPSEMTGTTAVANGGPAPVVVPMESRQPGKPARARTVIPASTGNWVLGKTIGAGSMGKVKLARKTEGGEEVCIQYRPPPRYSRLIDIPGCCQDRPSRLYHRRGA